jgi:SAM-dependent methyltransferase
MRSVATHSAYMSHEDQGAKPADGSSIAVYDSLAENYDSLFDAPGHRNIYDKLAWEHVSRFAPAVGGTVIDAGCGTGRWAAKWLAAGHRVIGIEESPQMVGVIGNKHLGPGFQLIQADMENVALEEHCADLVVAMGSVHYSRDPGGMIERFAHWTKPGGAVCVYVDSLVALAMELLRLGKVPQALENLDTRHGAWEQGGHRAEVHLLDRRDLEAYFERAGLRDIKSHGLLVTATAWGRERFTQAIADDPEEFLALERRLSEFPVLADAGKHLLVTGRRRYSSCDSR